MKKSLVVISVFFLIVFSSAAIGKPDKSKKFEIPSHAKQISDDVYDLGYAVHNGELVQGYAFVHKKDADAKQGAGKVKGSACFSYLSSGARWKVTEPYVLDTANSDGMSNNFVNVTVQKALNVWDSQVPFAIFGPRDLTSGVDGADAISPDGKNEIYFGAVADPNTIAVTTVWGIFSGPTFQRRIVEFDALFNDDGYKFGNADFDASVMDLENIAAHELGHAAGMGHPSNTCSEETMYAYAGFGETKKRDLNAGDINGIKNLYK